VKGMRRRIAAGAALVAASVGVGALPATAAASGWTYEGYYSTQQACYSYYYSNYNGYQYRCTYEYNQYQYGYYYDLYIYYP